MCSAHAFIHIILLVLYRLTSSLNQILLHHGHHLFTTYHKQQNQNSRSLEKKLDRKFNVIVHGVEESAEGKPRFMRQKEDTDKICGVFSQLVENITHQAIRDQFRLGKFNPSATRPRPILVKLIRSADVSEILSKAHELSHPIQVKPDKSPAEREKYKYLMGVRWALINSGIDRK